MSFLSQNIMNLKIASPEAAAHAYDLWQKSSCYINISTSHLCLHEVQGKREAELFVRHGQQDYGLRGNQVFLYWGVAEMVEQEDTSPTPKLQLLTEQLLMRTNWRLAEKIFHS